MSVPPPSSAPVPTVSSPPAGIREFLSALFDFSFRSFVTPRIIRLVYAVLVGVSALSALAAILTAYGISHALGFVAFIVSPGIFLLFVVIARIALELVQVLFSLDMHAEQQLRLLLSGLPPR